ncbi:gamma-butyrobetaine hydroxylase-like domain-containing protein [Aurantimonas sp. HBX-1]|uniref:gamma-butyrobetaine hydroxylase-like domain-containing protein n=1 Tax=Aurantimonas sp. HBX-1 TaxID=2906072 RepID=UPI001F31A6F0|nr:DUF971 domain-containing protein [Aurantimonas sp. HBX-1]UIJ73237.1 DUF971 domain-containing protein [Aurantimonas sp. HBX-1]
MNTSVPPEEIRVSPDRQTLILVQPGGTRDELSAEMLRVMSPSAEVQGHSPEQRKTIGGKRDVRITDVRPIGRYAVRIVFDDRHDSGIYSWSYLAELARDSTQRWQTYLDELAAKGLRREP